MPKGLMGFQKGHKSFISEETYKKIGKMLLGRKFSDESIKKMSNSQKGNRNALGSTCSEQKKERLRQVNLGKKFSEKTKQKLSESHKGQIAWNKGKKILKISNKNHWNWKGGVSGTERHRIMSGLEYKLWRKAVFLRDNFTCQKTGTKGGKLEAHHINNFSDFPELRTSIENGITLSKKVHREFHKIYGSSNNTKEQLIEFLNK